MFEYETKKFSEDYDGKCFEGDSKKEVLKKIHDYRMENEPEYVEEFKKPLRVETGRVTPPEVYSYSLIGVGSLPTSHGNYFSVRMNNKVYNVINFWLENYKKAIRKFNIKEFEYIIFNNTALILISPKIPSEWCINENNWENLYVDPYISGLDRINGIKIIEYMKNNYQENLYVDEYLNGLEGLKSVKCIKAPELSKDDVDFIKNLSKEMRTQDNLGTSSPYGILLTQREFTSENHDDSEEYTFYLLDGEEFDLEEACEYVLENWEEDLSEEDKSILREGLGPKSYVDFSLNSILEDHGFKEKTGYKRNKATEHNTNFFLTKKAYDIHVACNRHNLSNPQPYVKHLHRNEEMERLMEIIHKLAKIL